MVVSGQPLGQMNLADPFIYLEGNTYYAFGTESNDGFRCYSSEDLEHWVQVKGKAKSRTSLEEVIEEGQLILKPSSEYLTPHLYSR